MQREEAEGELNINESASFLLWVGGMRYNGKNKNTGRRRDEKVLIKSTKGMK